MLNTKIKIGACGTTQRTVGCLEVLRQSANFEILWVITPAPKAIGRAQVLTPSPVETWARAHHIPVKHVTKKLSELKDDLLAGQTEHPIDILFVVDFGYLIPPWMLEMPTVAPINVHPSDLPRWRGSSPGQCSLLSGETESAVCIMRLVWELDAGPVIARLPFSVPNTMTQSEYYATAFELAHQNLVQTLMEYAAHRTETAQPVESPTPVAARFERQDGFVPFELLQSALSGSELADAVSFVSPTLQPILSNDGREKLTPAQILDRMTRALSPWPGVWTMIPEYKGRENSRLKLLAGILSTNGSYEVTHWQHEGEPSKSGEISL